MSLERRLLRNAVRREQGNNKIQQKFRSVQIYKYRL